MKTNTQPQQPDFSVPGDAIGYAPQGYEPKKSIWTKFRKTKPEPITPPPDFYTTHNIVTTAVYVVNPELLASEDKSLWGKPFLFYCGKHTEPVEEILGNMYGHVHRNEGDEEPIRCFVGKSEELSDLLSGRIVGMPAKEVTIDNEVVKSDRLYNCYVPFSGGVYHETDVARWNATGGKNVRTDFVEFKEKLRAYDEKKKAERQAEERRVYESTLGYKIRHLLKME